MAGYIGSKASVTQVDGYNRTEADAEFVNDPNEVITVSGSNVGIGTDNPAQLLHLSKSGIARMRIEDTDAAGGYADLEVNGSAFFIDSHDEDGTEGRVVFRTAGTETMRIDDSGNVGIGKTNPATPLDVNGTVTASQFVGGGAIILANNQTDGTNYTTTSTSYQTASRFQITPSSSTSQLLGWFFCQMRAVSGVADGDLGNQARVHYRNSSGSWIAVSNVAANLRNENGSSTGLQEISATFPVLLSQGHLNASGVWDVAIRHFESYDSTSNIDDGRLHYMEYEP